MVGNQSTLFANYLPSDRQNVISHVLVAYFARGQLRSVIAAQGNDRKFLSIRPRSDSYGRKLRDDRSRKKADGDYMKEGKKERKKECMIVLSRMIGEKMRDPSRQIRRRN